MSVLAQKNILIGVSGGIAAYKIPLLIRKLIKLNSNVKVVMTPSSKEFVTPLTLSTVSKNEVFSEFTTEKNSNPTWNNHVELESGLIFLLFLPLHPIRFPRWPMLVVIIYYWLVIYLLNVLFLLLLLWI